MNMTTIRERLAKVNLTHLAAKSQVSLRTLRRIKNGAGARVETIERFVRYLSAAKK
jgi:DNA-binding Xre family transcriptional regulator